MNALKKRPVMSFLFSFLIVIVSTFLITLSTTGITYGLNHSSNITSNETWALADSPHIVTSAIHVYSDATLTIEPGCQVKFDSGAALYIGYFSGATLHAVGTSGSPITFTSNTVTPAPADWRGIVFFNSTNDGATIMDYCTVEYGGNDSYNSNINCNNASPTIQNCTIQHSDGYGIYCDNVSAPTLTNNTVNNNAIFPITLYCGLLDSNVTGNTGSWNGTDAIEVRGGNITSNRTWIPQIFYFNVTGSIHVYGDATLTIPPGCRVEFNGGTGLYIGYYSRGVLNAVGTNVNPIRFTSHVATHAPGDWEGIVFFNSTDDSATIMDYCTVEYGGYGGYDSNINCNNASPTIQNCTIQHSDGYGIYCDNASAPTLTNNMISNSAIFPITLYCGLLDSNVTGNTGSWNGTDAIEVRGGNITSNRTWIPQIFYFNVTGSIHVYGDATLTIPPGCRVEFNGGTGLYIGYYSRGVLNAVGTNVNPIRFTSHVATHAPGDWEGIVFFNSTDDSATIMDYCTVEYGGYGGYDSNINCNNASPTIQNCTIQHSDGYGIYCDNASAPTLTNNMISNSAIFPITLYCGLLDSNVTGNTGSGNGTNAIEVRHGSITSNHTWVPQDFFFHVTGPIHVYGDATLTTNPGCVVKFAGGAALYFGYFSGAALHAVGTSGHPIIFTSIDSSPVPGAWEGIVFFNSTYDGTTIMDYCTVEYGGYGGYNSNINCNEAAPTIQRCIVRNSDGHGIYTIGSGALPLISCSSLTNNVYGVFSESNSNPTIADCSITGNTSFGVYNNTPSITVNAENNWWGSADGPSGVGSGSGDAVGAYVDFTPWVSSFDSCSESIVLSPVSEMNPIGSSHTVTATITDASLVPAPNIMVNFRITSGPHAGTYGNDTTDVNGQATFSYTGTTEGTDVIEASYVDFLGRTITSSPATKTWETVTAIDLKSFTARSGKKGKVGITWETATEIDNAGFNLYRSRSEDGVYKKINGKLIFSKGNATTGATYRFAETLRKGKYYYKLEDVDNHGVSTMHGPVMVNVKHAAENARRRAK